MDTVGCRLLVQGDCKQSPHNATTLVPLLHPFVVSSRELQAIPLYE